MTSAYERGAQRARQRQGTNDQPNELDALPDTGLNRGRLTALARTSPDPDQRRNAAAILRRWQNPPPADDSGNTAA